MKKVAYYKGCLASLSAKELDISTRALAPKVGYELIELESVTCCGAGDIHEAEPEVLRRRRPEAKAPAEPVKAPAAKQRPAPTDGEEPMEEEAAAEPAAEKK